MYKGEGVGKEKEISGKKRKSGGGGRGGILFLFPHPLPFIRLLRRLCTCGFGIREKVRCSCHFFGVFLCGFAVFGFPYAPVLVLCVASLPYASACACIIEGVLSKVRIILVLML